MPDDHGERPPPPDREFDVVLYGATGFTGQLVAEYFARAVDRARVRWALAGRNAQKLEAVRERLAERDPGLRELAIVVARADDRASLDAMARRARVVLTTVGPYAKYGEPLVAACVEAGSDYVDLTGEPGWWKEMIERYHDRAVTTGALIISACGFDSIPHDLGALYTALRLAPRPGERAVVRSYVRGRGQMSGGTWQSLVSAFASARANWGERRGPSRPRRGDAHPRPRIHHSSDVGGWVVPMPTIDPLVVRRSATLCDDFGENFRYEPYMYVGRLVSVGVLLAGVGAVFALAQLGVTRRLLERVRRSGDGPSPEERAKGWFRVTHYGRCGDREVVARVSGGDPGYGATATMIAESALALAVDRERLPGRGGVMTTASAIGPRLIERLHAAGITFEQLDPPT